MMNRIDFTQSLKSNISIEQIIKNHFDELMSIYNVLGEYGNIKIEGEFEEGAISFELKFKSKKDALVLYESVKNDRTVNIYDRQFTWCFEHNGKVILVKLV